MTQLKFVYKFGGTNFVNQYLIKNKIKSNLDIYRSNVNKHTPHEHQKEKKYCYCNSCWGKARSFLFFLSRILFYARTRGRLYVLAVSFTFIKFYQVAYKSTSLKLKNSQFLTSFRAKSHRFVQTASTARLHGDRRGRYIYIYIYTISI